MTKPANILVQLSQALAAHSTEAARIVAAVRISSHRHITGVLWSPNAIVTSEQSLPTRQEFDAVLPGGESVAVKLAGRDPGTNLAVLAIERPFTTSLPHAAQAQVGEIALAYGSDADGGIRARMGIVNVAGPQWHSQAGGKIDARI